MSQQPNGHRSTRSRDRRIRVFSDTNSALRPEHLARVITLAGLEQARLEAAARADNETREPDVAPHTDAEGQEGDHA